MEIFSVALVCSKYLSHERSFRSKNYHTSKRSNCQQKISKAKFTLIIINAIEKVLKKIQAQTQQTTGCPRKRSALICAAHEK